jgi:hypothetical protein
VSDKFFRASPFSLTASPETAACWAGHKDVLNRLERVRRSLLQRSDSSLDLLWANLGAGKSHALYHLAYMLSNSEGNSAGVLPIFVELPDQVRNFQELYRRIVSEIPLDRLANSVINASGSSIPDDLRRCTQTLIHGSGTEKSTARQWLLGQRLGLRDLKATTNIQARIENDTQACDVLSGIITAFAENEIRLVVLLDEFQRIATLQPKYKRDAVLSNVRSIFSHSPRFFSVVVAVKSRIEQTAMDMLPEELRTLMGVRPPIALPEFSKDEAAQFVIERFRFFRPPDYSSSDFAPFGGESVQVVINHIATLDSTPLIPRTILQVLGWIYDSAVPNDSGEISPTETRAILQELRWGALD